ncbi:N-acetyl-1-D-myo-inositol-2-amino-2-deoxy-alpha-D-glucopyranoside deacetylase [Brevibacterium sanguinis]|uniref:N-acetyl-1-D-myo-inositol-2-amino-2-deoxy-alpha-D-glucopyranoside deacetylase n=2 Tax=Brevibacterium TaxID=1696 RepID=A0A366IKJ4_9MICO|nr:MULTISPECIES: N-acetyl-1-D-myo-inositol-2-amino-2-deoxy-alpha-D-glucopyranoside deacetylase [Brevibacterium]RBP66281.1 N-acetyl-1-D-myo-inositol-2-amino-2-deoxy-alpha-D-glucopyranoside deacetylase [Brevibacterium sanguinis]RBP72932.1 N-acetyl-1-D-myo-inositol-2-amino-2-deoxy-alpha-D-glucopyranoside deacetylase [Brevibacterium celere]
MHAHPDDETITTGGTIAALVAEGAHVTVLTATRGEGGEVIPPDLAHLEGDRAGLARVRESEIAEAMAALGVRDHRFLGGARSYEDSGMAWGPDGHAVAAPEAPANALCSADLGDVARHIAEVIDEVRPHAVVTYSANGGYGHPDHVRVHEATLAAVESAAWRTGRLLFVEVPAEVAEEMFDPEQPGFAETGFSPATMIPTKAPEGEIVIAQDISDVLAAKRAALAAHRTQVSVSGGFYALSNAVGTKLIDHEYYSIGAGEPIASATPLSMTGYAPHILTGLDLDAVEAANRDPAAEPGGTAAGPGEGLRRRRREPRKPGILAWIHAGLLGILIGALGALQHLNVSVVHLGGMPIILPWGLALALLLAACGLWHLKTLYRGSGPMLLAAFVIAILSYLLGQPQLLPGSDVIVTGTVRSAVWLLGPMLLAAVFAFVRVPRGQPSR